MINLFLAAVKIFSCIPARVRENYTGENWTFVSVMRLEGCIRKWLLLANAPEA